MRITPVSISRVPLVFDALPALKVRHYESGMQPGNVYAFARLYVWQRSLALSLSVFEKDPAGDSRVSFGVCGKEKAAVLVAQLSPASLTLTLHGPAGEEALPPPEVARFSGADEQGWYWGGNCTLPPEALAGAGLDFAADTAFFAGVVKHSTGSEAFGASFRPQPGLAPFDAVQLSPCAVVPY